MLSLNKVLAFLMCFQFFKLSFLSKAIGQTVFGAQMFWWTIREVNYELLDSCLISFSSLVLFFINLNQRPYQLGYNFYYFAFYHSISSLINVALRSQGLSRSLWVAHSNGRGQVVLTRRYMCFWSVARFVLGISSSVVIASARVRFSLVMKRRIRLTEN